jgi:hypothetical protein
MGTYSWEVVSFGEGGIYHNCTMTFNAKVANVCEFLMRDSAVSRIRAAMAHHLHHEATALATGGYKVTVLSS